VRILTFNVIGLKKFICKKILFKGKQMSQINILESKNILNLEIKFGLIQI